MFAENIKKRNFVSRKTNGESSIFEDEQDFDVDAVLDELNGPLTQDDLL